MFVPEQLAFFLACFFYLATFSSYILGVLIITDGRTDMGALYIRGAGFSYGQHSTILLLTG